MSELPKAYDPKQIEDRTYREWEASGFFNPDNLIKSSKLQAKSYTIHLPPPNVTGSLHMGHALNATLSDVLIRYHRMKGERTVWFPGTDHAGIATQNVVEKQLRKEGKSRWDLGREQFIKKVWEWKEEYGNKIINQLKKLGASCDWSRFRFTMDPQYAEWVKKAFLHYHKKGLIYRGKRVVSWCPRCQTSLSDLEIEYKEEKTKLWFIKYPLATGGGHIVVATTRPETMLGDMAVAVNPKDERYKDLVGKTVLLPIQNREIPIIADKAVEMEFGTGAVKVTPAHDLLDAEIAARHTIASMQVIDERGKMTKEVGALCEGLKARECREKVVEELKKLGALEKEEDYTHNISLCYRCGTELQPILSDQWFLKMGELAKKTLKAVKSGKTKILPKNFEKIMVPWLENIKDWCISRQIWWGHTIPIEGSDDVLDTWFSSALWPFAGLSEKDLKDFYPSNVLITARDIINLWVGRMIFSGLEFMKKMPFPEVLIHATILTKEGARMSKSKGTGIDPLQLIEQYGADATRFGIVWQAMGNQDIRWDETAVVAGKKFANKLWNIARFVLPKTANAKVEMQNAKLQKDDEEILEKLKNVKKEVEKQIDTYQFGQALHALYDFVWHDVADKYIEATKARDDEAAKQTLQRLLLAILKLLHPFMPFITEAIYAELSLSEKKLLMGEEW